MKKLAIVVATFGLMMAIGNNNQQEAKIAEQAAKIEQLTAANAAYYEGINVQRNEAERLNRVNQHYAQVLSAQ